MSAPHPECQPEAAPVRQHTPTPWRVFKNKDGTRLVGIGGQDGVGILDCGFGVWSWDNAEGIANADMVVEAVNSHGALKEAIEKLTKDLAFAKDYVSRALASYEGDPADNDYQRGFQGALQVVLDEAFTPQPRPPTQTDKASIWASDCSKYPGCKCDDVCLDSGGRS